MSNPCVNSGNACTESCTVRTFLPFCLFVKYFCYYIVQGGEELASKWVTKTMLCKIHHDTIIDTLQLSQTNLLIRHLACMVYVIKSKTIFDHFTLCLQISFKVVFSCCWNKSQNWWNIFNKTYGHFSFCSNRVIHNLGKQNIACFIFHNNVYFF